MTVITKETREFAKNQKWLLFEGTSATDLVGKKVFHFNGVTLVMKTNKLVLIALVPRNSSVTFTTTESTH